MESSNQALKDALEAIRDMASKTLDQIGTSHGERSMRWRCNACQYLKHFTKAVPFEAAGKCPRCRHAELTPIR
jgi:rubrerythrin